MINVIIDKILHYGFIEFRGVAVIIIVKTVLVQIIIERVCHVEFISDDEFSYCAGEVTSANGVDFDAPTIHFKRIVE